MSRFARELYERRVPHIVGIYLAAGWGLLEFTSWAAERQLVADGFVNVLLTVWIIGLPVTAILAWRGAGTSRPRAVRDDASVAVLPFANRSADPDAAFLADGITDEITTALARTPGLRVASRTSAYAFKDRHQDIRAIGRALGVRTVLEGSVQHDGERIRVGTQLVSVADGYQLWSGRFDRELRDLFAIEDEIAGEVADALRVLLDRKERGGLRKIPRADIRAYQYYLRGRQYYHETRKKSLRFARDMFRRAIEIDPEYALAHAALADTICMERTFYPASDADLNEADQAAERALALDPALAEAHSARGFAHFIAHRFDEAEAEFRKAIRLDPQLADVRYLFGRMRFQQGRMEEAARHFSAAADLRNDYDSAFFAAQALEALGREDEARDQYLRGLEAAEAHMDLNPDDARAATMRAVASFRTGRTVEGMEWGERAVEIDPEDAGVRYNVSCLFAVAGQQERALELLEQAVAAGFGNREWLERDPDLASIRDDPRFRALLDRMTEPEASEGETAGPDSGTAESATTTAEQGTTAAEPGTTAADAGIATAEPGSPTAEPGSPTAEPGSPTAEPGSGAS